jgi:hypothetical protein
MSSDPGAEIRASVAAHADLGPGYEDAVAEGLVERIGAEIDKRIDARLSQTGAAADAAGPAGYPGFQGGYQGYPGPVLPPGYQLGPLPAAAGVDHDRARQQVIELLFGHREAGSATTVPPAAPAAGELMGRLASIATRLNAIEQRLRQSFPA